MTKSPGLSILNLLVSVSGMLEPDHYPRLGPMLWHECLLDPLGTSAAAVSMSCGLSRSFQTYPYQGMLLIHAVRGENTRGMYPPNRSRDVEVRSPKYLL